MFVDLDSSVFIFVLSGNRNLTKKLSKFNNTIPCDRIPQSDLFQNNYIRKPRGLSCERLRERWTFVHLFDVGTRNKFEKNVAIFREHKNKIFFDIINSFTQISEMFQPSLSIKYGRLGGRGGGITCQKKKLTSKGPDIQNICLMSGAYRYFSSNITSFLPAQCSVKMLSIESFLSQPQPMNGCLYCMSNKSPSPKFFILRVPCFIIERKKNIPANRYGISGIGASRRSQGYF